MYSHYVDQPCLYNIYVNTLYATIGFEKFWPIIRFGILTKQRTSLNRIDNYKFMRIYIIMVIIVKTSTAPTITLANSQ